MNRFICNTIFWLFILTCLMFPKMLSAQSYTIRMGNSVGVTESLNFSSRIFVGRGMVVYPAQLDFFHMPNGTIFDTYTIIAPSMANGTIFCNPELVNFGSNTTCTITPNAGYYLAVITDNGLDVTLQMTGNTYSINNITTAHAINAIFGKIGDINNDDTVDLSDAIIAIQIMAQVPLQMQKIQKRADINGENKIGVDDAIYIMQRISGMR